MRAPRVSVVIPTRNRSALLRRAVTSVLSQTFGDFEVIVVDDASTDDGARRVPEMDPRIRYIRHDAAKGWCAGRNTGIRLARGEFVGFLDDDDEWLPEKLERQVRMFDQSPPDVGVVYTGVRSILGSHVVREHGAVATGDVHNVLFGDMRTLPVNNVTLLVRKVCFDDVGLFDEDLVYGEAWDMHVRLAKRWRFAPICDSLAVIHRGHDGVSADPRRVLAGRRRGLEKHRAAVEAWPQCLSGFHFTLGVLELSIGNTQQARWDFVKALAAWPWNVRAAAYYALSFQPRTLRDWFVSLWRRTRVRWERG
ncbi:MAG: glycosyltransferase family 2 protein [bacterium]